MTVYLIRCLTNNLVYVGQTRNRLATRWSVHKSAARCGSRQKLHQAIRKHGQENFSIEVLGKAANQEQLDYLEQYFIVLYNSDRLSHGYNQTIGGLENFLVGNKHSLGRKNSIETKNKMGISSRASWTEERKKRVSERYSLLRSLKPPKVKLPRKIRTHFPLLSQAHKAKISASLIGNKRRLGIPHDEESRKKIGRANSRKRGPHTPERCANISKAKKGKPIRIMLRFADITERRFGLVVAHWPVGKRHGRTMWLCVCDCGTIKVLEDHHLLRGATSSCGCLRKRKAA